MEPSLKNGSYVVFWRWGRNPKRGDIVLYSPENLQKPSDPNIFIMDYVGRVVGLPTESVRIENGNLYIDNNVEKYRVEEEYLSPGTRTKAFEEGKWLKIGEFQYLILTDKRDNAISVPSKIIHRDNIKGILLLKF